MKFFFSFFICCWIFLPGIVKAATADLSLSQNSIEFSEETLIVGDMVRIYATVKNVGDLDVSGYVSFFQGSLPIGDSQTISSRASSTPEEVYVDFVVPAGAFNIRAEIRGTDPVDENETNDLALTQLFTPIFDDDRDGVENDADNCSSNENTSQTDTDLDGLGDACDDDDDDDGLTDGVESEILTSPLVSDTDGDGLGDASDPNPTQPESLIKQTETVTESVESVALSAEDESGSDTSGVSEEETLFATQGIETEILEPSAEPIFSENNLTISPKAVFVYQQINWKTFVFSVQIPNLDGYRVAWDFGDGATSNKTEIEHVFPKSGDYQVTIRLEGLDGQSDEDSVMIHIPFFSLENPVVQAILGSLSFLIIILFFLFPKKPSGSSKCQTQATPGKVKISVRHD